MIGLLGGYALLAIGSTLYSLFSDKSEDKLTKELWTPKIDKESSAKSERELIELIWERREVCIKHNNETLYPKFIRDELDEDNNKVLLFKLPAGLDMTSITENAPALLSGLKKEIMIKWLPDDTEASFSITILSGLLKDSVDYTDEEKHTLRKNKGIWLSLGHSRRRFEMIDFTEPNSTHALICGAIGSGKSKLIKFLLFMLHLVYSPEDIEIWLCDLKKGSELSIFKNSPLVSEYIDTHEKEVSLPFFEKLLQYTMNRYQYMKEHGFSDIETYNENMSPKMPHCFCFIEEYALLCEEDENKNNQHEKTRSIIRQICTIARGCGIHIIISSQTVDGKILDPSLKKLIQVKVALHVDDAASSRLVLDSERACKIDAKKPGRAILKHLSSEVEIQVPLVRDTVIMTALKTKYPYMTFPGEQKKFLAACK